MKQYTRSLVSILALLLFLSCSSDDSREEEDPFGQDGDADMTALVNGMGFDAESNLITASVNTQGGFYIISIAAGDALDNRNAQAIALGMFGIDFDDVTVGTEWNTVVTNENLELDGAVAGFAFGDATDVVTDTGTDGVTEIMIRLTAIDKGQRSMSGVFEFVSFDEDTNTTYTVTDGVFTNISYVLDNE